MTQTSEEAIAQGSPYIVLNGKYLGRRTYPGNGEREFSLVQRGEEVFGFDPDMALILEFISIPRSTNDFSDWVIGTLDSDPEEIANALWEHELLLILGGYEDLAVAARDLDELAFIPSIANIEPVDEFGYQWRVVALDPTNTGTSHEVIIPQDLLPILQGDGGESIYSCVAKAAMALSIPEFMVVAVVLSELPNLLTAACGSLLKLG